MQSESHFAVNLMRHMVTPTFVLDASGHVVLWNRACERLTGVMADDVLRSRDYAGLFAVLLPNSESDKAVIFNEANAALSRQKKRATTVFGSGMSMNYHRSSPTVSQRYKNGIYNE